MKTKEKPVKKKSKRARSAKSGEFVSMKSAKENPDTTIVETVKK